MNFYYNYFASIGRESKVFIHYTLYTFLQCVFPEKVDFPDGNCLLFIFFCLLRTEKVDCWM